MYTFFTVFGFLFISAFCIFSTYIYDIFPITKLTTFIVPENNKGIWNKINIAVLPTIIWSIIELPVLGYNNNYLLAVALNIIINCAIMYEIKYSMKIFFNIENKYINISAIVIATSLTQLVCFMILKMKSLINGNIIISIIGIVIYVLIFLWFKYYPPKSEFFRGKNE